MILHRGCGIARSLFPRSIGPIISIRQATVPGTASRLTSTMIEAEYRYMHQALITGASQGFGRALLGALVPAAGHARSTPATPPRSTRRPRLANVRAVPGDVADSGTPGRG